MSRTSVSALVLGLSAALAMVPSRASAQMYAPADPAGNIEGFTVVGKGTASARPNRLEVDVQVSAASELSADAIVKYRDAKQRLREAFEGLKLEEVVVDERGLLVDEKGLQQSPYYFDYQPNRRTRAEVQLSRKLVVACSGIREMEEEALLQLVARLLDVAQDAGGQVGPGQDAMARYYYYGGYEPPQNSLVRFVLDDFEALEEEAYAAAIADAKARAARLAKLSQVELGPITAVRVAASPDLQAGRPPQDGDPAIRRLESSRFQEIPVRVELMVRFDVAPRPAPAAEAAGGGEQ